MENVNKQKDEFDFSDPDRDRIEFENRMALEKEKRENEGVLEKWSREYREEIEHEIEKYKYGFWELVFYTTLIVLFFPWSLIFCLFFMGFDETVYFFTSIKRKLTALIVGLLIGFVGIGFVIFLIAYFNGN